MEKAFTGLENIIILKTLAEFRQYVSDCLDRRHWEPARLGDQEVFIETKNGTRATMVYAEAMQAYLDSSEVVEVDDYERYTKRLNEVVDAAIKNAQNEAPLLETNQILLRLLGIFQEKIEIGVYKKRLYYYFDRKVKSEAVEGSGAEGPGAEGGTAEEAAGTENANDFMYGSIAAGIIEPHKTKKKG